MSKKDIGILTKGDGPLLRGQYEGNKNAERQQWMRLRNRITTTITDFPVLFKYLPRDQREQLLLKKIGNTKYPDLRSHPSGGERIPGIEWEVIRPEGIEELGLNSESKVRNYIRTGGLRQMFALIFLSLLEIMERRELSEQFFEQFLEELIERALRDAFGKHDRIVEADVDIQITDRNINPSELLVSFLRRSSEINDRDVEDLIHTRLIDEFDMKSYIDHENRSEEHQ